MFYNLIVFVLVSAGFSQVVVGSKILDKIRPKWYLFRCIECFSFWGGLLVFLGFWFSGIKLFPNLWIGLPAFGFLSSCTNYAIYMLTDDEGFKIKITY